MYIIGLCGFAGSGKTTAAKYLIEKYGFERLSFASPVKDVSSLIFGWDRARLEGVTPEDRAWREAPDARWSSLMGVDYTPRMGLQLIGNGIREVVHPNVWVELAIRQISTIPISSKIIFDDVRYVNERSYLRAAGAKLYTVHREGARGLEFPSPEHTGLWNEATEDCLLSTTNTNLHRSEWDWLRDPSIDRDPIIGNPGTLKEFHEELDKLMRSDILNHDRAFERT